MTQSPHIAVVLNITSDHLDWHKNQKEYVEAKKNIVKFQTTTDFAVINNEYKISREFAEETKAKVVYFSKVGLEDKFKTDLLLRGEHNLENIAAAVGVARFLKIKDETILEVVKSFRGLEHRLELVKKVREVTFYNDSFATGPQPTIAAIASFSEPLTVILGGSPKGLSYDFLGQEIARRGNIKNIILIGQEAKRILLALRKAKYLGRVVNLGSPAMEEIVKKAYVLTPRGGVVLLSPAAASFDMFANYKDRGEQFKKAVLRLR
jgi:UDP-N-acetylmuramoylalanine--D-glutamate ligase